MFIFCDVTQQWLRGGYNRNVGTVSGYPVILRTQYRTSDVITADTVFGTRPVHAACVSKTWSRAASRHIHVHARRLRIGPSPRISHPPAAIMSKRNDHFTVNPSILRISDDKTLQLVLECEKQECLWNTHLVDYPNKEERLWAYEVIAERLDIPNFTSRHVMTKFKNLRNSYCQELKKIAADEKYKPKVMWFAHMDKYLRPHLQKIKSYTEKTKLLQKTTDEGKNHVDSDEQIESKDWTIEHTLQSDGSCSNQSTQYRNEGVDRLNAQEKFSKKRKFSEESINDRSKIKNCYIDTEDSSNECLEGEDPLTGVSTKILEIEEMPSTAQLTPSREVEHYEAFGTYIASLLKSLPPKKALLLQPKIVNMIVSVGVEDLSDGEFDLH
ncbi:unnamed protein product [Arctia plantaginis]|uniref:MADF domain-containing protein n=1 Tax=Arctia plantaginis TaxID=874455 RepID=A0A8S0ZGE5_ARCPL|nr:unnamed protein product [Arctia plantaginis]